MNIDLFIKDCHSFSDFFEKAKEVKYDYILSNPAFSNCKGLFKFLDEVDKPFMLLLPTLKLHTQYMAEFFKNRKPPRGHSLAQYGKAASAPTFHTSPRGSAVAIPH